MSDSQTTTAFCPKSPNGKLMVGHIRDAYFVALDTMASLAGKRHDPAAAKNAGWSVVEIEVRETVKQPA